eukprot:scaffold5246_cov105-Isochrysis_galbana.AAC.1
MERGRHRTGNPTPTAAVHVSELVFFWSMASESAIVTRAPLSHLNPRKTPPPTHRVCCVAVERAGGLCVRGQPPLPESQSITQPKRKRNAMHPCTAAGTPSRTSGPAGGHTPSPRAAAG